MRTSSTILLLPLLLTGCGDTELYSQHLTDKVLRGQCVRIDTFDPRLTKPLRTALGDTARPGCLLRITGFIHHNSGCNNPQSLFPSRKDGYVRIEIAEGNITHYRIQANFESDGEGAVGKAIEKLAEQMVR